MQKEDKQKPILMIVFSLALCFGLLGIRLLLPGQSVRITLAWNLILAILPFLIVYFFSLACRKTSFPLYLILLINFLWLIFLPNSSYIFTDFIHITPHLKNDPNSGIPNIIIWYDIILYSLFAFVGHFLGQSSLLLMHELWIKWLGHRTGWIVAILTCVAVSYGVFVGRVLRLNSWDLILHPLVTWSKLIKYLITFDSLSFTLIFSTFMLASYLFVYSFGRTESMSNKTKK